MAKRILAVDDFEDLLILLADVLGDEGYDVVTCSRPREAYALAKGTRPDLVLLDVLMPGMNGWEVLNAFLLDREMRAIPVVIMTGTAGDARRRLARAGVQDITVLDKPFTVERLLECIDEALGRPGECERLYDQLTDLVTPAPIKLPAARTHPSADG